MTRTMTLSATDVVLRKELCDDGWNDRAIAAMVRSGQWVRIRHGAYASAALWRRLTPMQRHELLARAVLRQGKTELIVSHSSGMAFYEGPDYGLPLDDVHTTRTDGKCGRNEAGVHQHCGVVEDGDVREIRGVPVMSPTRVGLEVTTVASVEAALVAVNHLLHRELTTLEAMRQRYERGMVFWPDTLTTDLVLRLANAAIESVGESRFLYFCYARGLPAPCVQYAVLDEQGHVVARVDFAWPELGVFVEFDGRVKYEALLRPGESASDVVIREKRREERIVELTGWRCIRVTWSDLQDPESLLARIHRAFAGQVGAR